MNTEPKRKRRWYQFRLRTLLIGVTLVAIWCGWQVHVVAARKAASKAFQERGADFYLFDAKTAHPLSVLLWMRVQFIGDSPVNRIYLSKDRFNEKDEAEIAAMFPEAQVELHYGKWIP
jgi:hypothetical protein